MYFCWEEGQCEKTFKTICPSETAYNIQRNVDIFFLSRPVVNLTLEFPSHSCKDPAGPARPTGVLFHCQPLVQSVFSLPLLSSLWHTALRPVVTLMAMSHSLTPGP